MSNGHPRSTRRCLKGHHGVGRIKEKVVWTIFVSKNSSSHICFISTFHMYALKTYQAHLITPLDSPGAMASWVLSCLLCLCFNFSCAFPRGCSSSHNRDQATGLGSVWVLHFGLAELALAQMGWALALAGPLHLGLMATCPKFLASKATGAIG